MSNIYSKMNVPKDECYTSKAESDKLIEYLTEGKLIDRNKIIWLPFDNELSNIYKSLQRGGYQVVLSNLDSGLDFYNYEPQNWDMIITNPPFSGRSLLFKRLMQFSKPFIILQGTQFFNNKYAIKLLCLNEFKFILPEDKMNFLTYNEKENIIKSSKSGCAFYSFWLCYKISLINTFNFLLNNGKEKEIEKYDTNGNLILDNHLNLFNCGFIKGDD